MTGRTPTCVWLMVADLVTALDDSFGDPLDAYVNGSQTWLLDNGPRNVTLEWRLHPVAGYRRPPGLDVHAVFPAVARALAMGRPPPAPPAALWDGLEAFPAHGDEVEPAGLAAAAAAALGRRPDAWGLADHQAVGDQWERSRGASSIVASLMAQLAPA